VRGVDQYFVATNTMADEMAERGFDPHTVRATGIPIVRANYSLAREAAQKQAGQGGSPVL